MVLAGQDEIITECLQSIDSRIRSLKTLTTPSPMIYADVGLHQLVPAGMLGDGVGRMLSLSLAFYQARRGMILIDELENGLHHTVLCDIWHHLYRLACKFEVQIVATTHSKECLQAARRAFWAKQAEGLSIHRLDRNGAGHVVATCLFEDLDFTLDYGAEMR